MGECGGQPVHLADGDMLTEVWLRLSTDRVSTGRATIAQTARQSGQWAEGSAEVLMRWCDAGNEHTEQVAGAGMAFQYTVSRQSQPNDQESSIFIGLFLVKLGFY